MLGSCFGAGVWALLGFFNGIGRPRVTLLVTEAEARAIAFAAATADLTLAVTPPESARRPEPGS